MSFFFPSIISFSVTFVNTYFQKSYFFLFVCCIRTLICLNVFISVDSAVVSDSESLEWRFGGERVVWSGSCPEVVTSGERSGWGAGSSRQQEMNAVAASVRLLTRVFNVNKVALTSCVSFCIYYIVYSYVQTPNV